MSDPAAVVREVLSALADSGRRAARGMEAGDERTHEIGWTTGVLDAQQAVLDALECRANRSGAAPAVDGMPAAVGAHRVAS